MFSEQPRVWVLVDKPRCVLISVYLNQGRNQDRRPPPIFILISNLDVLILISVYQTKGRSIQDRRAKKKKKMGFVYVTFDNYTQFYFDWSQHTMFTTCNKYFQYFSYKNSGYVWRSIKANHSTALGPRLLVSKFLGPPLQIFFKKWVCCTATRKRFGGGEPLVMTYVRGSK